MLIWKIETKTGNRSRFAKTQGWCHDISDPNDPISVAAALAAIKYQTGVSAAELKAHGATIVFYRRGIRTGHWTAATNKYFYRPVSAIV